MSNEIVVMNSGIAVKDIPGFEGGYAITENGRIWSICRKKYRKMHLDSWGYWELGLHKNGKIKHYRVNRLVALTFIPNPENLPEVEHRDNNKLNNCYWNLFWSTQKDNMNHACYDGLKRKKLSEADIYTIRSFHREGMSIRAIARKYYVNRKTIRLILQHKIWGWVPDNLPISCQRTILD
jgi:hypothetical protein